MELTGYPKQATLKDGTKVNFRPLGGGDKEKLWQFFSRVPAEDRRFLRDDVSKKEIIESWINNLDYERVLPIIAEVDDRIVGNATLHRRKHGWLSHAARVRILTDKDFRQRGLGTKLMLELIHLATDLNLERLVAELAGDDLPALKAFQKLGFEPVATIPNHVKDITGKTHDLTIMVYSVAAEWDQY